MADETNSDIRLLSHQCDKIFADVSQFHGAQSHDVVEVLHQQFEQWTSNLSVYAKPHLSLDASLQYSESLRNLVLQLLQLIRRNLQRIKELENGSKDVQQDMCEPTSVIIAQMSQDSGAELSSLLVESLKALESGVDSLLRLGVAIQQASASTLTQRINDFINKKDDGTLEEMLFLHLRHRLIVTAQEREGTQGAATSLCRQLATSISFRYFGILYRRSHHTKKLGNKVIDKEAVTARSPKNHTSKLLGHVQFRKPIQPLATGKRTLVGASHLMHSVPPSDTAPSIPDSKIARQNYMTAPNSFFGARSIISVRTPAGVRYPKAPKVVLDEIFAKCPFCLNYHSRSQLEDIKWWERHVDQELRLYTCISEECTEPPQNFARFDEWKLHMDIEHSRQWICDVHLPSKWNCSMGHNEQHFEDETAFEQHVQSEHPEYSEGIELDGLKDWCAVKVPRPAYTCPVCNTVPEKLANVLRVDSRGIPTVNFDEDTRAELLRHIAQHLKQVGFMAADYLQEDDGIGSLITDKESKDGLPDGTWIGGEWQPPVSPYLDDEYKDYNPDSGHLGDYTEEWSWFAKQKVDIVLDWTTGIDESELFDGDDTEHAVRGRLNLTTALGGQDHPHTIHCLFALTTVLAYNEQYAQAETTLSNALELCASISTVDESMTVSLLERLNAVLSSFGRPDIWEIITQNVKNTPLFLAFEKAEDVPPKSQPLHQIQDQAIEKVKQLRDVLRWVSIDYDDATEHRLLKEHKNYPGVGAWIFQIASFQEWFDPNYAAESPILWLNGIMGSGKSMLAAIIAEEAGCLTPVPLVLSFYCRSSDPKSDNFVALGRSLLAKILRSRDHDDDLLPVFHQEYLRNSQHALSSPVLIEELLTLSLSKCGSTYIILDGLDECPREQRKIITRFFRRLIGGLHEKEEGVARCLFISRNDGAARTDFSGLPSVKITAKDTQRDITSYCRTRLSRLNAYFELSGEKLHQIAETVSNYAEGFILLAKLCMDSIEESHSRKEMDERCRLDLLPPKIKDLYENMMVERMMVGSFDQNIYPSKEDVLRVLRWLACAKRPLQWREIQVMNSIDRERQCISLDQQHIMQYPEHLLGSLVEIDEYDRLQLFHSSFKSYLIESGYVLPHREEQNLADLCMSYLNLPAFVRPPTREDVLSGDYGFMDYAVPFWLHHLEEGVTFQEGEEEEIMSSLTETLGSFINIYWKPHTTATPIEQHSNKLQCFRTLPFYDQLEQAAAATREQLRTFHYTETEENALSIKRTVKDVRLMLEGIASNSNRNDRRTVEEKYGTNIFKCPRFKCDYFSIGFRSAATRQKHLSRHDLPFICAIESCTMREAGFVSNKDLMRHMKSYHPDIVPDVNPFPQRRLKQARQTELKCPHCNSVYEKQDDLKSHLLSHDPQRSHLCEVCHKGFTRAADLKRHSYIHTRDRNFVCRGLLKDGTTWGCGRSFARTDALKKHHESRTGRACILPYLQEQEREPSRSQA